LYPKEATMVNLHSAHRGRDLPDIYPLRERATGTPEVRIVCACGSSGWVAQALADECDCGVPLLRRWVGATQSWHIFHGTPGPDGTWGSECVLTLHDSVRYTGSHCGYALLTRWRPVQDWLREVHEYERALARHQMDDELLLRFAPHNSVFDWAGILRDEVPCLAVLGGPPHSASPV
jgi:hypothetical protein